MKQMMMGKEEKGGSGGFKGPSAKARLILRAAKNETTVATSCQLVCCSQADKLVACRYDRGLNFGRVQYSSLVDKLNVLTQEPLALNLDGPQKKKVQEQLQGLEAQDELADDEAKKRLDVLLETLEGEKDKLEAVGFRWPGKKGGGFKFPQDPPNPFKQEPNAKRLQALRDSLGKS